MKRRDKKCHSKCGLRTQKDLVHRRRVILEVHDAREDQPRCLALWMRTRDRILGGEAIHGQVGFEVTSKQTMHMACSAMCRREGETCW